MNILYGILAAVFLVFVIFQGKSILPRVINFIRAGKRNFYFEDGLSRPEDERRSEQIQPVIEKMEALDFESLGVMLEKQPLWAPVTREIALASSRDKIFVSIGFRHTQPSYFFYTPFTGSQIVITAYNAFRYTRKEGFAIAIVTSGEPAEMLEEHKKLVSEFVEKGYTPFRDYNRETLIEATNQYYASPYTRQQMRAAAMISLIFWFICILVVVLFARGAIE
ncbi:MAG: hypothetical protein JXA46_03235 [Dehalococcoidales bacterium]|nr:hypothetical protein [Dehalococcoidales bacterium]